MAPPSALALAGVVLLALLAGPVAAQTCTDAVKNGAETDVDCGGTVCPKCLTARNCLVAADCLSGTCTGGKCQEPPACYNKVQDRRETDVDCGGGECYEACWVGKKCRGRWDCRSGICGTNLLCAEAATCTNRVKDGRETDVDCGGGGCAALCAKGLMCGSGRDCVTGACTAGRCAQPASCTNKVKDGDEGDIDCGGSCDAKCGVSGTCRTGSDCISGVCGSTGRCVDAPTCKNSIKDGRETDVDCGGGGCGAACLIGQRCASKWDCTTRNCTGGVCAQLDTCTNKVKDATEGDVDCGELCAARCGVSATCRAAADCISGVCTSGRCLDAPTCKNSIKDGRETDIDCGGGGCGAACDGGQRCATKWDCKSGVCDAGICDPVITGPTCEDGVKNGEESDVDCGGPNCLPCAAQQLCWDDGDCASQECILV